MKFKKKQFYKYLLFLVGIFFILNIGLSSYSIRLDDSNIAKFVNSSNDPECFITHDESASTKEYYDTIDNALDAANKSSTADYVVVIPGTSGNCKEYTVKNSHTINSNDRLVLPLSDTWIKIYENYDDVITDTTIEGYLNPLTRSLVDAYTDDSAIITKVTISDNKTLTVNGRLDISGYFGAIATVEGKVERSLQRPTGWTNYLATEVILGANSKIVCQNSSKLNCFGFIKQQSYNNGSVVNCIGSSVIRAPFTIYDFGGGSDYGYANGIDIDGRESIGLNTSECNKSDTSPFDVYSFHNIASVNFSGGGSFVGDVCISSANGSTSYYILSKVNIVGNSSGYLLQYYSSLSLLVNPSNKAEGFKLANYDNFSHVPYTKIEINGGSFNSISKNLKIKFNSYSGSIYIKTGEHIMSIPGNFIYRIVSGVFNINYAMRLLPGSNFIIDEGVTVNIKNNFQICSNYSNESVGTFTFCSNNALDAYPYNLSGANFEVNGTCNFLYNTNYLLNTSGYTYGGIIKSSTNNARISFSGGTLSSMSVVSSFYKGQTVEDGHILDKKKYKVTGSKVGYITEALKDEKGNYFSSNEFYFYNINTASWAKFNNPSIYSIDLDNTFVNKNSSDAKGQYDTSTHTYSISYKDGGSGIQYGDGYAPMLGSINKNYVVFDITVTNNGGWGTDIYLGVNGNSGTNRLRLGSDVGSAYEENVYLVNVYDYETGKLTEKKVPDNIRQYYVVPLSSFGYIKTLWVNGGAKTNIKIHSITFYEDYDMWDLDVSKVTIKGDTFDPANSYENNVFTVSSANTSDTANNYFRFGTGTSVMPGSVNMNFVAFDLTITNNGGWGGTTGADIFLGINGENLPTKKLRLLNTSDNSNRENSDWVDVFDEQGNTIERKVVSGKRQIYVMSLVNYSSIQSLWLNAGLREIIKVNGIKFYKKHPYELKSSSLDTTLKNAASISKSTDSYDSSSHTCYVNDTSGNSWFSFGDGSSVIPASVGMNYVVFDLTITQAKDESGKPLGWGVEGACDIYLRINSNDNYCRIFHDGGSNGKIDLVNVYDSEGNKMAKKTVSGQRQKFVMSLSHVDSVKSVRIAGGTNETIKINGITFYKDNPFTNKVWEVDLSSPTATKSNGTSTYDKSTHTITVPDNEWNAAFKFGDGVHAMPGSVNRKYMALALTLVRNTKIDGNWGVDATITINSKQSRFVSADDWGPVNAGNIQVYDEKGNLNSSGKLVEDGKKVIFLVPIEDYGSINSVSFMGGTPETIQINGIYFCDSLSEILS